MAELLKLMFSKHFVENLASEMAKNSKAFDQKRFIKEILNTSWDARELKDRMHHITHRLNDCLELDFEKQLNVLDKVSPKFGGFTGMLFPNFVEHYGTNHESLSMEALRNYTQYSSSEYAVRPFLKRNPKLIELFYDWSKDKNHHVRRLASEGCRPLLPWGMKLEQYVMDPKPVLPILERLKNDPEDYVYRSVANNLNDISKHHPQLVLDLGAKWKGKTETTDWVLKHALRTLLKKGNTDAMKIFGFAPDENLAILEFSMQQQTITIGDATRMKIQVKNTGNEAKFRFEYAISYLKNNGSHTDKVFHISEKLMTHNQEEFFDKKLDFKDLSTRRHYPGKHILSLKVNGVVVQQIDFMLK